MRSPWERIEKFMLLDKAWNSGSLLFVPRWQIWLRLGREVYWIYSYLKHLGIVSLCMLHCAAMCSLTC
jgi:hypothetical protein